MREGGTQEGLCLHGDRAPGGEATVLFLALCVCFGRRCGPLLLPPLRRV